MPSQNARKDSFSILKWAMFFKKKFFLTKPLSFDKLKP